MAKNFSLRAQGCTEAPRFTCHEASSRLSINRNELPVMYRVHGSGLLAHPVSSCAWPVALSRSRSGVSLLASLRGGDRAAPSPPWPPPERPGVLGSVVHWQPGVPSFRPAALPSSPSSSLLLSSRCQALCSVHGLLVSWRCHSRTTRSRLPKLPGRRRSDGPGTADSTARPPAGITRSVLCVMWRLRSLWPAGVGVFQQVDATALHRHRPHTAAA